MILHVQYSTVAENLSQSLQTWGYDGELEGDLDGSGQWCSGKFGTVGMLRTPKFSSPAFPFIPFPFPSLSGGNNFNDFPENQLYLP